MVWLGKPELQVTWELASSLPQSVIDEFEHNVESEVVTHTDIQYGQKKSFITLSTKPLPDECATKKLRRDRSVLDANTG